MAVHRSTLRALTAETNKHSSVATAQENQMSIEMIEVEEFHQGTQIKVIGVGGGGGNAVRT